MPTRRFLLVGAVAIIGPEAMTGVAVESDLNGQNVVTHQFGFGEVRHSQALLWFSQKLDWNEPLTLACDSPQLQVLNYDADSIGTLRSQHRNLYKIACLFVARRADLKTAYDAAGWDPS